MSPLRLSILFLILYAIGSVILAVFFPEAG